MLPFIPMIFMGQEYGETGPFLFFTSYGDPDLAKAVCEGRRREYEAFSSSWEFPDPQSAATFEKSELHWPLIEKEPHAGILRFYRDLIAERRLHPSLSNCRRDLTRTNVSDRAKWLVMDRRDPSGSRAMLVCNFDSGRQKIPIGFAGTVWRLALWSYAPIYEGPATESKPPSILQIAAGPPLHLAVPGYGALLYIIQPPLLTETHSAALQPMSPLQ